MESIKLYYFDVQGRAGIIRLILKLGNIPFEDIRLSKEEFQKKKEEKFFKYDQIPVLEINGKQYAQTRAIEIWAAKKCGYYPDENDLEKILRTEEVRSLYDDLLEKVMPSYRETDQTKKMELRKQYVENDFLRILGYFEKSLIQGGSTFISGDKLTYGDLTWFGVIVSHSPGPMKVFDGIPEDFLSKFPTLQKWFGAVMADEQMQKYLQMIQQMAQQQK